MATGPVQVSRRTGSVVRDCHRQPGTMTTANGFSRGGAGMQQPKTTVPPCPVQRSGRHRWRLDRARSTSLAEADVCKMCGMVRMTSFRTGERRYEAVADAAVPRRTGV